MNSFAHQRRYTFVLLMLVEKRDRFIKISAVSLVSACLKVIKSNNNCVSRVVSSVILSTSYGNFLQNAGSCYDEEDILNLIVIYSGIFIF